MLIQVPQTIKIIKGRHSGLIADIWYKTNNDYFIESPQGLYLIVPQSDTETIEFKKHKVNLVEGTA